MEENKKINEENLEEVAGGEEIMDSDCYFEPEQPIQYNVAHGAVSVKCKKMCRSPYTCGCYGSVYCVNKWHLVKPDEIVPDRWFPIPHNVRNHTGNGKAVQPLNIR